MAARSSGRWDVAALVGVVLLLGWLFYRNAWVGDDAYITFRSVEQLFAGNGPRWNPHERVQAFTHPLWFAVLATSRVVSAGLYWNSLILSLLATTAAIFIARRVPGMSLARWLGAVFLLASSKAFVDYAWSGLETPLSYALLAVLVVFFVRGDERPAPEAAPAAESTGQRVPEVTITALLAGLLALNHPDLILIAVPALAFSIWRARTSGPAAVAGALALGWVPLLAWGLFATVYFGTPLPNTAYAKLNTGIPEAELWAQGLHYLGNAARWDPVTIVVCAAAIPMALAAGRWRWIGVGLIAYLAYVVKIGGDFMAGRLFAPVVFVGALFAASTLRRAQLAPALAVAAVLDLVVPGSPLLLPRYYEEPYSFGAPESHGIADEKAFYFEGRSFRQRLAQPNVPPRLRDGEVVVESSIGMLGYEGGVDRIIVDENALADPLLARLPAVRPWRPGHFLRTIPDGYLESVREGANRLRNPIVRRLYEDVRTVTQGPLFSSARMRAMYRLHFATRRPDCVDPPCHRLLIHDDFPLEEYRPRVFGGGGQILSVRRQDAELSIEARLAIDPEARSQLFFVVTAPTVLASTLEHLGAPDPEGPLSNDVHLTLRFGDPREARRGARTLCLVVKARDTQMMMLESRNRICSKLLMPEGGGAGDL